MWWPVKTSIVETVKGKKNTNSIPWSKKDFIEDFFPFSFIIAEKTYLLRAHCPGVGQNEKTFRAFSELLH